MMYHLLFFLFTCIQAFYTKSNFIYDKYGRILIFHGINRVNKNIASNYYFEDMLKHNESFLLKKHGFNVVRLGWMWDGFQHHENQFNLTYFKTMENIVNNLGENGIYTILDMHQDVFSSLFCSYDGIPLWVAIKSVSKYKFPWPLKKNNCSRDWQLNHLSEASSQAYDDLYHNKSGMLHNFITFWEKSINLWENNPYILGYELINEPFPGNFFKDPLIMIPSIAGKKNLQPFYDKVRLQLGNINNKLLFYEPITWGMIFDNKILDSGLEHVPGGDKFKNSSVYSYHYYCSAFLPDRQKHPILQKDICDDFLAPEMFKNIKKHVVNVGGSSFMTEFGACDDNDYNKLGECDNVLNYADKYFQSWTDYTYAQVNHLNPTSYWSKTFSRTYPQAIAGMPLNMSYNRNTTEFQFCYTPNSLSTMPTEIYFTNFQNIQISENLDYTLDNVNNKIYISSNSNSDACINLSK